MRMWMELKVNFVKSMKPTDHSCLTFILSFGTMCTDYSLCCGPNDLTIDITAAPQVWNKLPRSFTIKDTVASVATPKINLLLVNCAFE